MGSTCAKSCAEFAKTSGPILDTAGELEQCAGWAEQGECTRNPRYMLSACPKSCGAQRANLFEGLLDDHPDCIDRASPESCGSTAAGSKAWIRSKCAGSCALYDLCMHEADPAECRVALRCRELQDGQATCARHVNSSGCDAYALKNCYLSCARHDLAGVLQRYRAKISVRTRKWGWLDEDGAKHGHSRRPFGQPLLSLPCWQDTPFDERPAATCENARAALLHRLQRRAHASCRSLGMRTPRAPRRRHLDADAVGEEVHAQLDLPAGHVVSVLPVLLAPKIRLAQNFVTAEEAEHIIKIGVPRMHRSLAGETSIRLPFSPRVQAFL